ncbi:RNA polymerase recycling motor HelD [Tindallia californiensis]|uniref:DNA 3'-5' helicase n=1 Tax=Tindallia californiensis TaxID=159292 RepID=A0A1H3P9F6_9FIRM|nr:RNA polymerase recycling motor HelD [Tindallia californiensis]SDY97019.1 DNA helicase-2 / ATP-dependent DNA helicase PcrA [Tindallia californiensis]
MPKDHKEDFPQEVQRLEETKDYLEQTIGTLLNSREKFKEEIKDAYLHLDFLDSSLSYSSIMLNSKMLDELEKNFALLMKSRQKPYFARMDLKQKGKEQTEAFYIGKVSLFDETMDTPLVVDWRAPIASVYYDGRLGETSYKASGGTYAIDLYKKRQYTIEEGNLQEYMDVDISTSDAFLQASLENHAGEKLKDIVSTIQEEQNTIIRADITKPLIIQGVAGSGKTTIALHRIAYLIYTYSDTFVPEDFMIIAPNHLFLDYISGVLPELGAERVHQTTYIDLMFSILGKKHRLTDSNEKLRFLVKNDPAGDLASAKKSMQEAAAFKNSMDMKKLLDLYIQQLKDTLLPEEDFCIGDKVLLTRQSIHQMVHEDFSYLPLYKRIDRLKKMLSKEAKNVSKKILASLEHEYDVLLDRIRSQEEPSDQRTDKLVSLMNERDEKLEALKKEVRNVANHYIKKIPKDTLLNLYQSLFSQKLLWEKATTFSTPETLGSLLEESNLIFASNKLELEDLAPMAYLHYQLFGLKEDLDIKYAVIDEAQDFSDFQFHVLREVLGTDQFTILGDLSQGIHMYRSITDWSYLQHHVFQDPANYLTLEQSYRTTIEIMNMANWVLSQSATEHLLKAKPVVRHGQEPTIKGFQETSQVIHAIHEQVKSLKEASFTTIAIITKSQEEATNLHKKLVKKTDLKPVLVTEKTLHFDHSIFVIPAHLSKGLEFDAVIITTLEDRFTLEALDAKLLYVAMTRALHRLSFFYTEGTLDYSIDSYHPKELL